MDLALAFPQLETLLVGHEGVTDEVLGRIGRIKPLKNLSLFNPAISDAGLAHLKNLPRLVSLDLDRARITDAGLAHVGDLAQLERLRIIETPITDAGLIHLERLTRARSIFLRDTEVTDEGVARLKGALPYAVVVHDPKGDPDWWGLALSATGVLASGVGLAYLVRRGRRAGWPWAWKAAVVAGVIGLVTAGLWRLVPVMRPVRDGDAGGFWLHVTDLDVGAKKPWTSGWFYRPRDGWHLYYDLGFHGRDLYRVPEADVRALFPLVVERLRNAPPGRLRPDVEAGFQEWLRTGGRPDDVDGLLATLQEARYRQTTRGGETLSEHLGRREEGLDERWERFGRYPRNFWSSSRPLPG